MVCAAAVRLIAGERHRVLLSLSTQHRPDCHHEEEGEIPFVEKAGQL